MHGGDIYRNQIQYDFSVNLNPLGIPQKVREIINNNVDLLLNYPDEKCEVLGKKLSRVLSSKYKTDISTDEIVFGNGASELIPAILRAEKSKKVYLVAPGFTGYKKAVISSGAKYDFYVLKEQKNFDLDESEALEIISNVTQLKSDTLILTNPNNPNGKLISPQVINLIANACKQMNVLLVLDECFMELTGKGETYSYLANMSNENIVILRAFTKTFAIPGLRLGYCICKNPSIVSEIRNQLPEWNVSTIAQKAGIGALEEAEYFENACKHINEQREFMQKELESLKCKVFPSDGNFVLLKSSDLMLKDKLLKKKILIRDCCDYDGLEKGFYRIAIKSNIENEMLIMALKEVL